MTDDSHSRDYGDLSKKAYGAHKSSAGKRGIGFHFTYAEWVAWWRAALDQIGPQARRGRQRHEYVMARFGDLGDYEPSNVKAILPIENIADRDPAQVAMTAQKMREALGDRHGAHLKVRGYGHPKSHTVLTAAGEFGSIALASEHHGITPQGGSYRVRSGQWIRIYHE